ncbi:MAG: O-antigen ligase family protein [Solirubrobacteraceae bacterium]|nr:O-antigen ligase family protein [Solirubrobacteraceae bacterium]
MTAIRGFRPLGWAAAGAALAATAAVGIVWVSVAPMTTARFTGISWLAAAAGLLAIATRVEPARLLTVGLVLTPMAGNWARLGLPPMVAPDRLLLAAGIVAVFGRTLTTAGTPLPRWRAVHTAMALYLAVVVASALAVGTFFSDPVRLVDRGGLLAFGAFAVAPVAFATARDRRFLLWGLTLLGAYLSVTAVLEITAPQLVVPSFIVDPSYTTHAGRARGPALEASANGLALFSCGMAALILRGLEDRPRVRALLVAVVVLCALGVLLTLTRSVWIGAITGTVVAMLAARELRPWLLPTLLAGAVAVALAFTVIPGLESSADSRASSQTTVWDRQNLNTAAVNMFLEQPLVGQGWDTFGRVANGFFWQGDDYPLTVNQTTGAHNVVLARASEIGLIGVTLWAAAIILAIVAGLTTKPATPDLRPWRLALIAMSVFVLVLVMLTPAAKVFTFILPLMWAGVAAGPGAISEHEGAHSA